MPELIGRDEELHALERFLAGLAGVYLGRPADLCALRITRAVRIRRR